MKKLIITAALTLLSVCALAQTKDTFFYAEIVGTSNLAGTKVTIEIDFGQATRYMEDTRLRNEDGTVKKFNSMVDAMNWMGTMGWEFQQAYVVTNGNINVYHWLLKKNTKDMTAEELESLKDAFPTKHNMPSNN